MLWHIELNFCIWLCLTVLQIKFECRQFASIFVGVMPLLGLRIFEIHSFLHYSPTCFDILSWIFAYDFVSLYYRSSLSVVNFRQFLLELCPFWNLQYWKYTVFRSGLLHALTYTGQKFYPNAFPFFIKIKPKKIQVSRFELWFKARFPLFLSQKYGMVDENHSTVTGFFESSKTWF